MRFRSLIWLLLLTRPALAQDEERNANPRAALQEFVEETRQGHYEQAARATFPLSGSGPGFTNPADTARELIAVIDTYVAVKLPKVPDSADGSGNNTYDVGRVPSSGQHSGVIRLLKVADGGWVFSPATLNQVPGWYASLPDHWIRQRLPDILLRAGWQDLLWWQWLVMPLLVLIGLLLGRLIALLLHLLLPLAAKRMPRMFQTVLARRMVGPLTLAVTVLVAGRLLNLLILTLPAQDFVHSVVSALALAALFWGGLRLVDLGIEALSEAPFTKGSPERLGLLPLFRKAAKVTLGVIAAVEVLQRLGYPAASLIAGLGIGGLAFALAAQKTVENLFGSVMLGMDQPFRPGDTIRVDDLVGTVETVGLRSTRIRTDRRTIVTIPNGRLSDMRIETFAPRDRILMSFKIGLAYSTRAEQMSHIIGEIREYLSKLPEAYPGSASVFFTTLAQSSMDVEGSVMVNTKDFDRFQQVRQEGLLAVMAIIERNGAALAVPTQTIRVLEPGDPKASPPKS